MSSLIKAVNLRKTYGVADAETVALADASLTINQGEFVAIMGASGSGKSTLLQIIGLLGRPTSGSYILEGKDTTGMDDAQLAQLRNQSIGFVFQSFFLLPRSTVLENVILPLQYSDISRAEYVKKAQKALEQVNLTHRIHHKPTQLSGGEKQRVAIARALINQPHLILADEPTGNLDSRTGEMVMQTIDDLHKKGHTIILITHETPTASYADRIIELKDGNILSDHPAGTRYEKYNK